MRALAIVHQPDAGPGVFRDAARAAGHDLEDWLIQRDPEPPRALVEYGAILTFGGAMNADQEREHVWLAREKELLGAFMKQRIPVLGVCLGAQLLAAAAGGDVRRAPVPEIGWYQVRRTAEGGADPLLGPLAPEFLALEWHSYEFSAPPSAVRLAESDVCLQAFRLGEIAWGVQFHAEVTADDFGAWIDDYRSDSDAVALGVDPDELRARTREEIAGWNELGRRLCTRFLALAAGDRG